MADAINGHFGGSGPGTAKAFQGAVRVISRVITDPGPLLAANSLPGDAFGGLGGKLNNNFDGAYIDDIIIGYAERGEMITAADENAAFVNNPNAPVGATTTGPYQLELRRTASEFAARAAPDFILTRGFDTNDRAVQGFTIITPAGADIVDGQTFEIHNGLQTLVFEWNNTDLSGGALPAHVELNYVVSDTSAELGTALTNAINSFPLDLAASHLGNGRVDVFGAGDVRSIQHLVHDEQGDENRFRDQGQLIVEQTQVSQTLGFGISILPGDRDGPGSAPHPGPVRNLPVLNPDRFTTGPVLTNNVIFGSALGAVQILGDNLGGANQAAPAVVPRVVNNTFGGQGAGTGLLVDDNVAPLILNSIVADFNVGINIDPSAPATVQAATVFQGNVTDANGPLGGFSITLPPTDPLFVDRQNGNLYLAEGSVAIDTAVDSLQDRADLVQVRSSVGIPASPLLAPILDVLGRLRVDDISANLPPFGFKDRGAFDRSDFVGPRPRCHCRWITTSRATTRILVCRSSHWVTQFS